MTDPTTRIELTAADRAAVSALLNHAETIVAWLLGRRETELRLSQYATRAGWSQAEYAAAFEHALRQEMIEWDVRTQTWGASRSWASKGDVS